MPKSMSAARTLLLELLEALAMRDMRPVEIEQSLGKDRQDITAALESLRSEGLVSEALRERGGVFTATAEGLAALAARGVDVTCARGRVAVMFTDLVSSTTLIESLGEREAHAARLRHFALLRDRVARHRGHEVKSLGDGLMVVFDSPADAIACAGDMQHGVRRDSDGFRLRVGIDAGEPMRERGDYFGTPVIIAKRLCDAAAADEILITDRLGELIGQCSPAPLQSRGPLRVKGFAEPVTASAVAV